ncbi:MAG: DUF2207 domain-containing protein [Woeseiaceae bacterium]|nr:DUF2207 domain-containing protein [Woeseiaceae bacterium]
MKQLASFLLVLLPLLAPADERILSFHSDVVISQDGWIEVTETIRVRAEGNRIRRGIYRDFPTEYFDKLGNRYEVDFQPLAVLRNDASESFHSQNYRNGVRTYFGSSDRYIEHGVHTYRFRYRASRMLGFFESHDELYWNVTGFDWAFPIDEASATVRFNFEVPASDVSVTAFTGPYGSSESDYTSYVDADSIAHFAARSPLSALNGLTIVVMWPKGLVAAPTFIRKTGWMLKDNLNLLIVLAGFAGLLAYYIPVWRRYGKDPDEGVLVTRYVPPEGFSPASLRYIRQMYYDNKVMTAAIVNLAVKGYLRINDLGSEHTLFKLDPGPGTLPLAAGEKELYESLFEDGKRVVLEQDNHVLLGGARSAHSKSLKKDYKQHYFQINGLLNIPAILIVLLATALALVFGGRPSFVVVGAIVVMFLTMAMFAIIMKRPTLRGRKILDEMLGFKDYLEIAEKDELNLRNPPEKTPQLFEAYLPYALALGVEQNWAEKFAAVLDAVRGPRGRGYQPDWYSGSWDNSSIKVNISSMSSDLGSAISSSVTPPGSSSGGGGGGFSGGGGGGGGGGGW